jgi:hypothetical protein
MSSIGQPRDGEAGEQLQLVEAETATEALQTHAPEFLKYLQKAGLDGPLDVLKGIILAPVDAAWVEDDQFQKGDRDRKKKILVYHFHFSTTDEEPLTFKELTSLHFEETYESSGQSGVPGQSFGLRAGRGSSVLATDSRGTNALVVSPVIKTPNAIIILIESVLCPTFFD